MRCCRGPMSGSQKPATGGDGDLGATLGKQWSVAHFMIPLPHFWVSNIRVDVARNSCLDALDPGEVERLGRWQHRRVSINAIVRS